MLRTIAKSLAATVCCVAFIACSEETGLVRSGTTNNGSPIIGNDVPAEQQANTAADRQLFASNVQPILEAKCATCHQGPPSVGPAFLGASADAYYDSIVASGLVTSSPDSSLLVTKGPHDNQSTATYFSADETSAVNAWIESREGAGSTDEGIDDDVLVDEGGKPTSLETALARISSCASYDLFLQLNVNDVCLENADTGNNDGGPCIGCHTSVDNSTGFHCDEDPLVTHTAAFNAGELGQELASGQVYLHALDWVNLTSNYEAVANEIIYLIDQIPGVQHPDLEIDNDIIDDVFAYQESIISCYSSL